MAPRHGGRKVCYCTSNNITHIDYKDVDLLKKPISECDKILPRRVTGTSAKINFSYQSISYHGFVAEDK